MLIVLRVEELGVLREQCLEALPGAVEGILSAQLKDRAFMLHAVLEGLP